MTGQKKIKSALISVFDKTGLDEIVEILDAQGVTIYSTGGTQKYIEDRGINVIPVENLTTYPSILGGRVKTLHPKVFGGILGRRELEEDVVQLEEYEIPELDLVIVDLYPFEDTVASDAGHQDIIEKIDIGGISLIRAAAKNYKDVVIVPSKNQYAYLVDMLKESEGHSNMEQRQFLAASAFAVSSHYDTQIFGYFNQVGGNEIDALRMSADSSQVLRYGENPHQQGRFHGDLNQLFDKLHGKELSYNNLLDVDAAVQLMGEFKGDPTFAILKHNNACGIATRDNVHDAYIAALQGDPVSAFGGILISNTNIDAATAEEIHKLFCEVVIAPSYDDDALEILKGKKNRIILIQKECALPASTVRTALNGLLEQDKDTSTEVIGGFELKTAASASEQQLKDLEFAIKVVKHTKSNTVTFVKNGQLCASGTGQTSRVDACRQAIEKAGNMGFDLNGAVMASDAFFPFPDCVELAHKAGVTAVVQPGGSIKDELSIDYCNEHKLSMYFTGIRHFRH